MTEGTAVCLTLEGAHSRSQCRDYFAMPVLFCSLESELQYLMLLAVAESMTPLSLAEVSSLRGVCVVWQ